MRELRVEDALLYLDQVKVEFGDRPHIYNEFLDIMKTFKTQQIDTPGVIRRVSNLFQGNRRLVLGFNTFLPEGYRIELPDGDGPPVAVFRAPGELAVRHDLSGPNIPPVRHHEPPQPQPGPAVIQVPSGQQQQQQQGRVGPPGYDGMMAGRGAGIGGIIGPPPQQQQQLHHKLNGAMMDRVAGGAGGLANKGAMHAQKMGDPHGQQQQQQLKQQQQLSQHHSMGSRPLDASAIGRVGLTPQPGRPGSVVGQGQSQPPQQVIRQQQAMGNTTPNKTSNGSPTPVGAAAGFPQQPGQPLEFDHAIHYVTQIKKRFADEPETYKKFLEILHTYQKEQRGIKEVLEEVSVLFEEHPDLLKEFTFFLPDAVQSEAKKQLAIVVKEAEERRARKLAAAKQAAQPKQTKRQLAPTPTPPPPVETRPPSASIAFGATAPRSLEREKEIHRSTVYGSVSFGPPRPPRKNMPIIGESAKKEGRPTMLPPLPPQPTTAETAFFERAKRHLSRRELAPDKPTGRARHTPYAEFLKCLHLFGSGVLNKDELVLLLRGLFVQGHAPKSGVNAGGGASNPAIATDAHNLLTEFQEILIGRGPYADQQCSQKDKSKFGAKRGRDIELSIRMSPSYSEYPKDYPHDLFMSHTGQSEEDLQVLNSNLVSVGNDKTPICAVKARRNAYEEAMFKIEDERFEVDMAIERNALAMRKTEPIAEEVQMLREGEEKDGQPIGRLQYKLNARTLNSIQINSIGRIYGDNGDEVIQYLVRNPLAVLPIIYQRLRQKDLEWRKQKSELMPRWKAGTEANYEGSLDDKCYFKRRALEKSFGLEQLRDECKQARQYCSNPNKRKDSPVSFGLSVPDKSAVFYQPYASIEMKPASSVHHNAVGYLIKHISYRCTTNFDAREKVGRIWTEFMLPFFGYPTFWVLDESRKSYRGKINNTVVQCKYQD
jgi:paired amphipathic helix protein Sin3a